MKTKEFIFEIKKPRVKMPKQRDPNWRTLQAKGTSGAGGAHRNEKRAEKQGDVKHKKDLIPTEDQGATEAKRPDRAMPDTDLRVGDRVVADTSKENYPGGHKQRVGIVTRVGQKGVHIRTDDSDEPEWHPYKIVKKQNVAASGNDHRGVVGEQDDWGSMSHRDFKRRELQHELGHETNNVSIDINGKPWKVLQGEAEFPSRALARAEKIAATIKRNAVAKGRKEPKVDVYVTGAPATE
jgi:hypothetical protein